MNSKQFILMLTLSICFLFSLLLLVWLKPDTIERRIFPNTTIDTLKINADSLENKTTNNIAEHFSNNSSPQYSKDELEAIAQIKIARQKYSHEEIEAKPYLLSGLTEKDMGISYYSIKDLNDEDKKNALQLLNNLKTLGSINGKLTSEFQREDDSKEQLHKLGDINNLKLQFKPVKLDEQDQYKLAGINRSGGMDRFGNADSSYQLYFSQDGKKFEFTEQYAPVGGNVQIKQVQEFLNSKINQNDAIYETIPSAKIINIHWQNQQRYYSISTQNLSRNEATAIAENIDRLSKKEQR